MLDSVVLQNVAEPSQGIPVRHLVAGIHAAEVRKGAAVYDLCHGSHVGEVIQVLQYIEPQHQFQIVGLISALSFVIARSDLFDPFSPRDDALYLRKKLFFLRPYSCQLVAERGQGDLFIHTIIIPRFGSDRFLFLCGVAFNIFWHGIRPNNTSHSTISVIQ